jgi:amino acid transporter
VGREAPDRLGTIEGVFIPTMTTILGVILYVRTGWVVGQVGLAGAIAVVLSAFAISATTALSIASIASNVRVGGGGAFALLVRTLGIEPAGSIGLPLYVSQTLAIAMYLFGFREGWLWLFPDHPAWAVDLATFGSVFAIGAVSARFAFRLQFALVAVIAASLFSVFAALPGRELEPITWWASDGVGPAAAFAVFFPAVTGILAGVNLSGELEEPPRAIRRGSLAAIAVTLGVYLAVAVIMGVAVPVETLRESRTALVDVGRWNSLVLAGLLGATFSSALSTAVGAPRILTALAAQRVVPAGSWLSERGWRGQPHRAMVVTALIVGCAIAMRDLNRIAPLVTLFFLLTYGAINLTLLAQQGLQLPRFRPRFRVPLAVPFVGLLGCGSAMLVIRPVLAVVCIVAVVGIYVALLRTDAKGPYGQVRAGIVVTVFRWILARVRALPERNTWQPRLLIPFDGTTPLNRLVPLIGAVCGRSGVVDLLDLRAAQAEPSLEALAERVRERVPLVETSRLDLGFEPAVDTALNVLGGTPLSPNLVVVAGDAPSLVCTAREHGVGLWVVYASGDEIPDADRVSIWVADLDPEGYTGLAPAGLELVLLTAWRLHIRYGLPVELAVSASESTDEAEQWLERVASRSRIPGLQTRVVDDIVDAVEAAPPSVHFVVRDAEGESGVLDALTPDEDAPAFVFAYLSGHVRAV